MAGALEKIIEQIRASAQSELNRLRAEHKQNLLKIEEQTNKLICCEKQKLQEKIENFKVSLEKKMSAENFIFKNKAVLATKQKLFFYVLKKAAETLCCSSEFEQRYFSYMEKLIEKNLTIKPSVLVYGKLDYLRFCENLKFKSSSELKIEKSEKFKWGAEILCSNFEIDLNIEHMLFNKFDNSRVEILNFLAKKGIDL